MIHSSESPLLRLPNTFHAFYGGFSSLHKAQKAAIVPILSGRDLVLQSATGSGKSEAVLAPAMERVILSGKKTAVLYIIPTKALAHDLKRRFEPVIAGRLGLNLAVRTGDIKPKGKSRPDILFTTPESLDVMLGSSTETIKGFLYCVGTLIIDEVHPLVHQYRGRHLAFLLSRLERRSGRPLQKIAMSATIADAGSIIGFFGFKADTVHIVADVKRRINARLLHIRQEDTELCALLDDLYTNWQYRKILVFANSRSACDRLLDIVNRSGKFQGVCELHYSNLKPLERKSAEKRFRNRSHALCIATSTLELGIDVGDVDAVVLYEPPGSVSAFLQRIGRANRREDEINFWGICTGERAGEQVVRFLALLDLAGRGIVEASHAGAMPSVLGQQVISCLYEKRRISLPALQSLFPEHHETLPSIFASLEKRGWLSHSHIHGLLQGSRQYHSHFLEYKIWGNFPETEEAYILEVSGQAVADIPRSIVGQMDLGENVFIAGYHIKITAVEHGPSGRVVAVPSNGLNEKQLAWIGKGVPVSYELSQVMGKILKTGRVRHKNCLFHRTENLFRQEKERGNKPVILQNGIEVVPGKSAPLCFRTFIGSMGNLILEWSIRDANLDEDFFITSDEMGLECSDWIKFEQIDLPVDRPMFQAWAERHFKLLSNFVPLNMFCKILPKDLIIEEMTDFIYDDAVAGTFARYLAGSSNAIID